jgi:hypothetical protein
LRSAIERGAEVVVMRGYDLWRVAVPELGRLKVIRPSNPQSAYISRRSVGNANFNAIVRAVIES